MRRNVNWNVLTPEKCKRYTGSGSLSWNAIANCYNLKSLSNIFEQFTRHGRLNQSKNDTRASYVSEIITMSCSLKNIANRTRMQVMCMRVRLAISSIQFCSGNKNCFCPYISGNKNFSRLLPEQICNSQGVILNARCSSHAHPLSLWKYTYYVIYITYHK